MTQLPFGRKSVDRRHSMKQTASHQEQQFGYNCDFIAFLPLPRGSGSADHGLLVVNHEFTNPELKLPGYLVPNQDYKTPSSGEAPSDVPEFRTNPTQETVDVELASHGVSVVEIRPEKSGAWQVIRNSQYNRRLTGITPMEIAGPAAGSHLLRPCFTTLLVVA